MRRKIRAGTFSAYKAGRSVRMTEQQIADALEALEIGLPSQQEPQRRPGVTAASMRRRQAL
jgi:hypothetical protein